MNKTRIRLAMVSLLFVLPTLALANTIVEIVQSVPEQTNLGLPGVRQAKDVWPEMIANAKSTIDIAQMYVQSVKDRSIEPVLQAMEAAGNRGVKIRFLLGSAMVNTDKETVVRIKAIPNLSFALYDISKVTGGIHHAKYFIIDGKEIFVGSQNFDWLALEEIHETGVRILDAALALRLETVFMHDWNFANSGKWGTESVPPSSPAPLDVELVSSPDSLNPTGITSGIKTLISLVGAAKTSIHVTLLDYTTSVYGGGKPWTVIDDALRAAAKRGVKIELLVSHWNTAKTEIDSIKSLSQVPNIEVRINTVPDLPGGHIPFSRVVHSKTMVIDQSIYWVGTSNWSKGYFDATRDIEIVMKRPDLALTGEKIFQAIWTATYSVPVDVNKNYPTPVK
jgi:phosphatidylserine/phosphatidylglycerophosphate/cardiolipin synthase-like enzyme